MKWPILILLAALPVAAQPPRHLQPFPCVEAAAGHVGVHGALVGSQRERALAVLRQRQLVVEQELVVRRNVANSRARCRT